VRLSTKGELRPCLASPRGVSLRDLMRAGETDEAIAAAVRGALWGKDVGHHFLDESVLDHHRVTMSGIGG
jgi:cyclic pyranopterin phosphate synthase